MDYLLELKLMLAALSADDFDALEVVSYQGGSEADHFFNCKHCGQAVDYRRLGDVLYHDEPEHQPLAVN